MRLKFPQMYRVSQISFVNISDLELNLFSDTKRVAVKKENAELLPSDLEEQIKIKPNGSLYEHSSAKKSFHDNTSHKYHSKILLMTLHISSAHRFL